MSISSILGSTGLEAWLIEHGPQVTREAVWDGIADYCKRMEDHWDVWHYLQARPMRSNGRKPERGGASDCSELATVALYWARLESDVPVPDPNGRAYEGYGYTGTYPYNLGRRVSPPYEVGDMALYGSESRTTDVTICRRRVGLGRHLHVQWLGSRPHADSGVVSQRLRLRAEAAAHGRKGLDGLLTI